MVIPMTLLRCCILLVVIGLSAIHVPAQPSAGPPSHAGVNRDLVGSHVLPRYHRLKEAARDLARRSEVLCTEDTADGLDLTRRSYHELMGAWMGVQHLLFGPVETASRAERLYFWPEAH